METMPVVAYMPHAIVVPFPEQSHIKGILKFAKLLHHKGLHITFVNTESNHQRFLRSRGSNALDGLPNFHFETIPGGLPRSANDAPEDLVSDLENTMLAPFKDLVARLNNTASVNNPPVTCIVSDAFMPFTIQAGEELGLPVVMYVTMSACGYMGIKQLSALREKGYSPLKDESYRTNGYLETTFDWIPGMKAVQLKDFAFIQTTDPNDMAFNFLMRSAETSVKASAIALHTFDALEPDVLHGLSSIFPSVYAIGPLQLLLNQAQENGLRSIGYNLWKEESECLQWLDAKEPNSVVYVNFGSITVVTSEQLIELAMGLADSKHTFLWTIRPDMVIGESANLPAEFVVEAQKRGFIASWCPQEEVLNHPSVGGFLTHSGWNSTIESLAAGVPMLCWPFFADQPMNCKYTCTEWEVGMEINNNVKRGDVEKLVRELMEGEKVKKMRERAMEWKMLATEATGPNGSSSINLEKFINEMLIPKN